MNVAFNASTLQKKYHYLTNECDSWLSKKKEHDSCFLQIGWNKRNYIYINHLLSLCFSFFLFFIIPAALFGCPALPLITSHACLYLYNKSNCLSTKKKKTKNEFTLLYFTLLINSLGTPIPFWNRILNNIYRKEFIRYTPLKLQRKPITKMSWF